MSTQHRTATAAHTIRDAEDALPGPAYCGMVVAGKGGSGGDGARVVMGIEVTARLSSGRPSILRSA
ncbi:MULTISPECIES: hypothetical protein [Streptomyces]|uniref:Uncharacterized protein n=1 Tax=Streptomyces dengpaensis TaxID=2049881 RepID=A0ABM6SNX2_9ACTN|nr:MULTISPECIES: hypothetical protein [Streptomyces]AVH56391.1 hypothetical protein C4B68_12080 [Streptomyces dengpaensis]PIB05725.1 hypothetical protein B1C81_28250 [Streptomyces sp. HG99]